MSTPQSIALKEGWKIKFMPNAVMLMWHKDHEPRLVDLKTLTAEPLPRESDEPIKWDF